MLRVPDFRFECKLNEYAIICIVFLVASCFAACRGAQDVLNCQGHVGVMLLAFLEREHEPNWMRELVTPSVFKVFEPAYPCREK